MCEDSSEQEKNDSAFVIVFNSVYIVHWVNHWKCFKKLAEYHCHQEEVLPVI